MKSLRILLFFFLCTPVVSGQVVYVVSNTNALYRLTIETCSLDFVVQINRQVYDISFHPDGTLYGISGNGNFYEIDTLTGMTSIFHSFNGQSFNSLTISANGTVYTIGDQGELWAYDLVNDLATYLGDIGFSATGDLTFYKGNLYVAVSGDRIVRINLSQINSSNIIVDEDIPGSILGIVSDVVDCNEINCYAITNGFSDIYQIDFDNHSLHLVCNLNITIGGGASTSEFLGSSPIHFDNLLTNDPDCKNEGGSVTIEVTGGYGMLEYSLDGSTYQLQNMFTNLGEGTYTILVRDQVGCIDTNFAVLIQALPPVFDSIMVIPSTCGMHNGSILAVASGGSGSLRYSLDSIQFQSTGIFENLSPNRYDLFVVDSAGCSDMDEAWIDSLQAASILNVDIVNVSCGGVFPGSIRILTDSTMGILYSLDGINFQSRNDFESLGPGPYLITIEDTNGCRDTMTVDIGIGDSPVIEGVSISPESCGQRNGSIMVNVGGGTGPIQYSIDGNTFQVSDTFNNLQAGNYEVIIIDSEGCSISAPVLLHALDEIIVTDLSTTSTRCGEWTGTVSLEISGGTAPILLSLNNESPQIETFFGDLQAGDFHLSLTDAAGCQWDTIVTVTQTDCPVYIPNVFSPNGDGVNDFFKIETSFQNEVLITRFFIFDRWGNNVYENFDFPIHSADGWWDGTFKKFTLNPGVFAYYIEVLYTNGDRQTYKGSITLIR